MLLILSASTSLALGQYSNIVPLYFIMLSIPGYLCDDLERIQKRSIYYISGIILYIFIRAILNYTMLELSTVSSTGARNFANKYENN
jgi:hypothetical protein